MKCAVMAMMLAMTVYLSGCAVLATRVADPEFGTPYIASGIDLCGVAFAFQDGDQGGSTCIVALLATMAVIDLVPSLVVDTVLLPVDIVVAAVK